MKINNKFMRMFAMFASVLMLTIVAMPMVTIQIVAAETSTENEIKREFVPNETIEINKIPPIPPWVLKLLRDAATIIGITVVATLKFGYDHLTSFTDQTIDVNTQISRGERHSIDFNLNVPLRSNRDADHISLTISAFDVDSVERHRVYIDFDDRFTHDDMFLGILLSGGNQRDRNTRFTVNSGYLDDVQDMMNDHSGRIRIRIQACPRRRTDGVFIRTAYFVVDY